MNLRHYFVATGLLLGIGASFLLATYTPRADASRNSAGSYSLPGGNPVVNGTTITSSWANTTLNDISTEMTNSLDRNGRGGMSAPLQLYAGSASVPGLDFALEPATGIYRAGSGDVRLQINANQVMRWTDAGTTSSTLTATSTSVSPYGLAGVGFGGTLGALRNQDGGVGVIGVGGTVGLYPAGVVGVGGGGAASAGYGVEGYAGYGTNGTYASGGYFTGGQNSVDGGSGGYGLNVIGGNGLGVGSGGIGIQIVGGAGGAAGNGGDGVTVAGGAGSGSGNGGHGLLANGGTGGTSGLPQAGIIATGGTSAGASAQGITSRAGISSTTTASYDAITVNNGAINMDGTANVISTVALKNRITTKNITKAWAALCSTGSTWVIQDGFNIQSISGLAGTTMAVQFVSPMADTNYAVLVSASISNFGANGRTVYATASSTTQFTASQFDPNLSVLKNWNPTPAGACVYFHVLGAQ